MKLSKTLSLSLALLALVLAATTSQGQSLAVTNGLQLWLKADAGITTNASGGVTLWKDQTANKNDAAQSDDTAAPLLVPNAQNTKPVVRFDGNNDFLDVASAPSLSIIGEISSYFVVKFDDFATYRAVWAQTVVNLPAPNDYYLLPGSGIPRAYRGDGTTVNLGSVDGTTPVRAGSYVVLGFQMSGTTFTHYLNGQPVGSGEITITPADGGNPLKIGTRDDLFTKMKGDIAELVIFNRALTAAERASLVTYMQTKYGIVNQPPTVSLTSPANNTSVTAPGVVTLAANAADPDGVISKVDFFANGALIGTATAAPYKIQVLIKTPGSVTLGAVATDNKDATSTATNVTITATGTASASLAVTNNLQLWLKGDAGITKAGTNVVATWKDQSGKGNDAIQPAGATGPIVVNNAANGNPVVRFDGVADYLDVASSDSVAITGDITSFFVVNFTDFSTYRAVWGKTEVNVPRPTDYYIQPNGVARVFRGSEMGNVNQFVDGPKVSAGSYLMLGFSEAGTTMTHYLNGSAAGSGQMTVIPTDSGTPLKIGTRDDLFTKMKGDIAEVLIYDKALSTTERGALATYLGAKYGIPIVQSSNSLPTITITGSGASSISAPTNITVSATAADPDGSVVRVDFFANGGLVGSATKSPYQLQFLVPVGGPITLTAMATDNLGGQTTSTQVVVNATAKNPPALPVTTNLVLWLKADGGVTASASGFVTSWVDFSGNFNNALQADLNASPLLITNGLNQLPTLRFDGVNDFLEVAHSSSLVLTGDVTSLFVAKFDDFTTYRAVWAQTAGNQPRSVDYFLLPTSGLPHFLRGGPGGNGSIDGTVSPTPGTFSTLGFEMVGTTLTHYLDGTDNGSGDITAVPGDVGATIRIGTRGDSVTRMKGDIAEILVYNTALSDGDRNKVNDYLHTKYFVAPPPVIRFTSITRQGTGFVIQWLTNATLEEAVNVGGPWTTVANATSPYTVTAPLKQKFYRLRM